MKKIVSLSHLAIGIAINFEFSTSLLLPRHHQPLSPPHDTDKLLRPLQPILFFGGVSPSSFPLDLSHRVLSWFSYIYIYIYIDHFINFYILLWILKVLSHAVAWYFRGACEGDTRLVVEYFAKEYWEDNFRTSLIGLFKVYGLVAPWLCVCCVNSWVLLVFFKWWLLKSLLIWFFLLRESFL
jgi:hypothetical protein